MKTIVFIHGMYMTATCWDNWSAYFNGKGYRVFAPAWPGREQSVEMIKKAHPDSRLGKLTLSDVVDSMSDFIQRLDEKPVVIGHSMGGLVTQILLQKDLAAGGIAIDSAPPMGVFALDSNFLKANWGHITPFANLRSPVYMTFEQFQFAFVNTMALDEQRAAYELYAVPESRAVPRESLTAKIDFAHKKVPLLMIAGGDDHLIPASLNRINYRKYAGAPSPTDFKEFPGRCHFLIGQKGWEEIAGYCLDWITNQIP